MAKMGKAMTDRKVMRLVLETLEGIHVGNMTPMAEENWNKAIAILRQALEKHILADSIRPKGKSITKVWVDELRGGDENLEEPPNSTTDVVEPVAWIGETSSGYRELDWDKAVLKDEYPIVYPLYAAPPKREWVGLTDEELREIGRAHV